MHQVWGLIWFGSSFYLNILLTPFQDNPKLVSHASKIDSEKKLAEKNSHRRGWSTIASNEKNSIRTEILSEKNHYDPLRFLQMCS